MRKTLTLLILTLIIINSFAQTKKDSTEHLTFKGVPLNGTLIEYVSKMKQKGFTHVSTENGVAMLKGDFAGYKDCLLGVSTLKQKDLVHKIGVLFPEKDTWSALSGNYFDLKKLLTEKYGEPSDVVEKFDTYAEPRDDGSRIHHVKFDQCKYYSIWQTEKGEIQLSISHIEMDSCFVKLSYIDKFNSESIKKQALDDL